MRSSRVVPAIGATPRRLATFGMDESTDVTLRMVIASYSTWFSKYRIDELGTPSVGSGAGLEEKASEEHKRHWLIHARELSAMRLIRVQRRKLTIGHGDVRIRHRRTRPLRCRCGEGWDRVRRPPGTTKAAGMLFTDSELGQRNRGRRADVPRL